VTVHNTAATGDDVPEYLVTINTPTPANGSYFVSGETFTVDITLKNHADGSDVDSSVYTTDGSSPVKVKVIFTYEINKGQISAPVEKTLVFKMHKAKDSTCKTIWKAVLGH
jgi:hypothetical protein